MAGYFMFLLLYISNVYLVLH